MLANAGTVVPPEVLQKVCAIAEREEKPNQPVMLAALMLCKPPTSKVCSFRNLLLVPELICWSAPCKPELGADACQMQFLFTCLCTPALIVTTAFCTNAALRYACMAFWLTCFLQNVISSGVKVKESFTIAVHDAVQNIEALMLEVEKRVRSFQRMQGNTLKGIYQRLSDFKPGNVRQLKAEFQEEAQRVLRSSVDAEADAGSQEGHGVVIAI